MKTKIKKLSALAAVFFFAVQIPFTEVRAVESQEIEGPIPTQPETRYDPNAVSAASVQNPADSNSPMDPWLLQSNPLSHPAISNAETSEILAPPEGWTRTPSNPNFAYRIVDDVTKPTNQILQLLNISEEFSYDVDSIDDIHRFRDVDVRENGEKIEYHYSLPGGGSAGSLQPVLQKSQFTAAASNPNFSFAVRSLGSLSLQLYLYNSQTKHATLLAFASLESYLSTSFDVRDVSADGKYVVYSMPSHQAKVQSIDDPTQSLVVDIEYGLKKIEWLGNKVLLEGLDSRITIVNLNTLTADAGWKRAPSNANFLFRDTYIPVGQHYEVTLQLMNLTTGAIQNLTTLIGEISQKRDVSPNGKTVVYETGGIFTPNGGRIYTTHVQSIEDPSKKISIDNPFYTTSGVLHSIAFEGNGNPVVRLRNEFQGTVIEDRYGISVNTRTWQVSRPLSRLISQGSSVHVDPDTKLVTMIWRIYNPKFEVWIYDASEGTNRMRVLKKLVLRDGPGLEGSMTFIDAHTTPGGRQVVSFTFVGEVSDFPATFTKVIDPRTGQEVAINGVIKSVHYEGIIGIYTVQRPNGSIWTDYVNLETMQPMTGEKQTVSLTTPLYRLYHPTSGDHFYTINSVEVETAKEGGYVEENIAGYLASSQEPGTRALYRLYNPNKHLHFYTTSATERDAAVAAGLVYEEITGYVLETQLEGSDPVYRFYNSNHGSHVYTMSESEKAALEGLGYILEGKFYMALSPTEIEIPESVLTEAEFQALPSTVSNPNFKIKERTITDLASTQIQVYDVFTRNASGQIELVTTFTKSFSLFAFGAGSSIQAMSVPDASPDGRHLTLGQVTRTLDVNGDVRNLQVLVYDRQTGKIERTITLQTIEARDFLAEEIPSSVQFLSGSSVIIQVTYPSGKIEIYNVIAVDRMALIAKTDAAIAEQNTIIVGLEQQLSNQETMIEQQLETFTRDMENGRVTLVNLKQQLVDLMAADITTETKNLISPYREEVDAFLSEIESLKEEYIRFLENMSLVTKALLEAHRAFLQGLLDYKNAAIAADFKQLEELAANFPSFVASAIPDMAPLPDPRDKMNEIIDEGNALVSQINQEIEELQNLRQTLIDKTTSAIAQEDQMIADLVKTLQEMPAKIKEQVDAFTKDMNGGKILLGNIQLEMNQWLSGHLSNRLSLDLKTRMALYLQRLVGYLSGFESVKQGYISFLQSQIGVTQAILDAHISYRTELENYKHDVMNTNADQLKVLGDNFPTYKPPMTPIAPPVDPRVALNQKIAEGNALLDEARFGVGGPVIRWGYASPLTVNKPASSNS